MGHLFLNRQFSLKDVSCLKLESSHARQTDISIFYAQRHGFSQKKKKKKSENALYNVINPIGFLNFHSNSMSNWHRIEKNLLTRPCVRFHDAIYCQAVDAAKKDLLCSTIRQPHFYNLSYSYIITCLFDLIDFL